jgi:hypothetical protein
MNYLKIIIHFADNAQHQEGYKSHHHSLFCSIVRLINKNNWNKTKIDLGQILHAAGMSKPTYIDARKWLVDNNWIEVVEGKNAYQMAEFSLGVEARIEDIVEDNTFTSTQPSTQPSDDTSTSTSTVPIYIKPLSVKGIKVKEKENYTKEFEDFWKLYEKPNGKVKSFQLWQKLSQADKDKIKPHLEFYKKANPDSKFRKDPERYLFYRTFDDIDPAQIKKAEEAIRPKREMVY